MVVKQPGGDLARRLRRRLTSPAAADLLPPASRPPEGPPLEVLAAMIRGSTGPILDRSIALLAVARDCVRRNPRDVDDICAFLCFWLLSRPGELGRGFLAAVEFYLSAL